MNETQGILGDAGGVQGSGEPGPGRRSAIPFSLVIGNNFKLRKSFKKKMYVKDTFNKCHSD